jgi:hypothetical protein
MSKSNGYYSRFYEMGTYSFTPMEEVFITDVWYAHLYRELKKDYLKARNAVLPQFQVEANERARIFYIISDLQEKSGVNLYSYFHSICESQKFTYIDSMTQKEITFEGLQCHDYIFLSDFKYRVQNPQSGEWTVLTTKTYADEWEDVYQRWSCKSGVNGGASVSTPIFTSYLHAVTNAIPMGWPGYSGFYMEDVWCDIMAYKVSH